MLAEAKKTGTTNGAGMVGDSTRMSCKYQGKPIPDIRWLRHGKAIENDEVKYKISVDNASEKDVTSYLEIIKYVFFKHKIMLFYHLFNSFGDVHNIVFIYFLTSAYRIAIMELISAMV